jgi:hypothetical protein
MFFQCDTPRCEPIQRPVDIYAVGSLERVFPQCPRCGTAGRLLCRPTDLGDDWDIDPAVLVSGASLLLDAATQSGVLFALETPVPSLVQVAWSTSGLEARLRLLEPLDLARAPLTCDCEIDERLAGMVTDMGLGAALTAMLERGSWWTAPELLDPGGRKGSSRVMFGWRRAPGTYLHSTGAIGDEICQLGLDLTLIVRPGPSSWIVEVGGMDSWHNV